MVGLVFTALQVATVGAQVDTMPPPMDGAGDPNMPPPTGGSVAPQ